jgi:hypothetical protein
MPGGVNASLERTVETNEGQLNPVQKLIADFDSRNAPNNRPLEIFFIFNIF